MHLHSQPAGHKCIIQLNLTQMKVQEVGGGVGEGQLKNEGERVNLI